MVKGNKMTQFQDKLMKYPKIHSLGSPETDGILDEIVVIESKIDGANFRCRYLPEEHTNNSDSYDKLIFGSRNNQLPDDTNPEQWIAIKAYKKAFEEHKESFIPNVIYFSESMQKHTLSYENIPDTIGYDIFDVERNGFWHWKASKQAFENIDIPFINVHYEGLLKDITQEQLKEYIKQSPYRKEGDEGIVIKCYRKLNTYGRPLFAKIVDDVFKEKNKTVFKGQTPVVKTDDSEIAAEYFTEGRFIKAINHFKDDNQTIDMSLMPKLFKYISEDILSENILEIGRKYNSIEFKKFNNIIAGKSAKMLKEYLMKGVK